MGEETMWAVQYAEYGGPDVLRVGTVPRPRPSREQVLVEVAAFSINGADLLARRGRLRVLSGFGFPKGTGVDFAGTIRERGADVTSLRVGDRVWGYLGVKPPGAHAAAAQYVVASTDVLAVAPD
ncbi:MAG: alcohol dehydrogenase catalytic domain-containing protein, partial [Microbacterium sp.]